MIMGLGLVLVAAVAALTLRPRAAAPATAMSQPTEDTFAQIPRVSPADAKTALDAGSAVFVDVRDPASYANGHIPGARSLPLAGLEAQLGELDPQDWIITYCT